MIGLFCLCFSSCVPVFKPVHTEVLFFSAEVWGGTPFNDQAKKQVFTEALESKSIKRLEQTIPFASQGSIRVERFVALYEVDARQSPPSLKNGFELWAQQGSEASHFMLTNKQTGISWLVKLYPNRS